MKNKIKNITAIAVTLAFCLVFIIRLAGISILRQYISYGIGDCRSIPILCMEPDEKTVTPEIDKEYYETLVPQSFPKLSISIPKGFSVVQELIKRRYYKRRKTGEEAVIYLLRQEPKAFLNLYPDVKKMGVNNNYEFIQKIMQANLTKIKNIPDAFFVIVKSLITPDIGPQNISRMIRFELGDKTGFINYTMTKRINYFDCSVFDAQDNFFKVYIKDVPARLDLNKVFTIISSLKPED